MVRKTVMLVRVLWVYFFTFIFSLVWFFGRHIFRLQGKSIARKSMTQAKQECYTSEFVIEQREEDESESMLRFRFPTFEEFVQRKDVDFVRDQLSCDNSELMSKNCMVSEHLENIIEPRMSSEVNMIVKPVIEIVERRISSDSLIEMVAGFVDPQISLEAVNSRREVNGSFLISKIEDPRRDFTGVGGNLREIAEPLGSSVRHESDFHSDDESLVSDSDSDSKVSSNSSLRSSFIDSPSDGFLSDIDFQRAFEIDTLLNYGCKKVELSSEFLTEEDIELRNLSKAYGSDNLDDVDEDILHELRKIERDLEEDVDSFDANDEVNMVSELLSRSPSSEKQKSRSNLAVVNNMLDVEDGISMESELLSRSPGSEKQKSRSNLAVVNNMLNVEDGINVSSELFGEHKNLVVNFVDVGEDDSRQSSEKSSSGEQLSSDSENGLEREWEHQDLVEQLKMEIKDIRAIGLPTILEDSESPKIMDDLQPWKIEQKYPREGTMDELHKFYKSYSERMRKLDILNFQKMYAIGFLRLNDPFQSFTRSKFSIPALSAILSLDFWPCKPKITSVIHPPLMKKFTRELESDIEMVYVGQMCLSWEFLCWQYDKALDLWDSDPRGMRQYNEVAEKFQMFQVVLTRFLEDDPFQGPRVQHYVKNRCVLRNLLQVPVIQDDNYRDRKKERKVISRVDAVTSLQLVEIIEESIRLLWQLIRTDKDAGNPTLVMRRRSSNVELQSPADASLFEEVRSTLQKKDKKLKELSRSERCVLKKFRKQPEDDSDGVLHFFSRVDLKLVSRVLNMSRISTDQLVWCSDKLNKISFVGRELHVEPSLLFFPCS